MAVRTASGAGSNRTEPSSVQADVYVWQYALLVVQARTERKEVFSLGPQSEAKRMIQKYTLDIEVAR